MKFTYLPVDFCILIVPLIFSFHPRLRFGNYFNEYFLANIISAFIFLVWDAIFTANGVWGFSDRYTLGLRIFQMPIEEVLFFFCIPFACLFTYHCFTNFFTISWAPFYELFTSNKRLLNNILKFSLRFSLIFFFLLILTSCNNYKLLPTVPLVDLNKYSGKWYELASFPQFFQKGCTCTIAEYSPSEEGYIIVKNSCRKDSINGKLSTAVGKAFVEEGTGNSKLMVQFFWPFNGKYWIIDLADDYSYAVVGHPNREYLWILSRSSKMEDSLYSRIINHLHQLDFDTSKLVRTLQI